jgi:hypothetical protein
MSPHVAAVTSANSHGDCPLPSAVARPRRRQDLLLPGDAASQEQAGLLLPGTGRILALIASLRRLTATQDAAVMSFDTLPGAGAGCRAVR